MRRIAALLTLTLGLTAPIARAETLELLMIERDGCYWCARWTDEIGPIYPKTPEGRRAPLRRVNVTPGWPAELADFPRERMTPSFILLRDGVETGRIRGYPGEDFFWALLAEMLGPEPAP